ncbi:MULTISPECIES: DUF1127 domain-containing protein [unclassified Mesorhizobium]|uniref:DUF1127 domain-containing protein n=1 Tax=unclassified Mesorhizobium TaxID=325217 RepID=UPI000F75C81B|nr:MULTISPECIES: DUF1127 domain-containing protein [unclassified Mesorhizobium]TGT63555.1 DUF1127 domain-containing protein [Mesorhizobium sp. M00.F.Ca.ET.170.01.1.1]AZO11358.1 DUF1127 domain-containing protein [Mesorhizobium sp. M3A.F.Ca.ET.080.04.2.1]RWB76677.1 MAG: DUF1127 domain-containing protein [Mesorhizobium sp.]RWB92146.1 MAG: DUF1127 domain-containing protein [Mesorhizobium sp.]RWE28042.1 MAG: DUF1127 domain-containing protein [Mesorhizobium sp.]
MNDTCTLASAPHQAARTGTPAARPSRRRNTLAALRSIIASWRARAYFRRDLKRMSETNPHLIDDIGLTREQAEEEIAKLPFWQR